MTQVREALTLVGCGVIVFFAVCVFVLLASACVPAQPQEVVIVFATAPPRPTLPPPTITPVPAPTRVPQTCLVSWEKDVVLEVWGPDAKWYCAQFVEEHGFEFHRGSPKPWSLCKVYYGDHRFWVTRPQDDQKWKYPLSFGDADLGVCEWLP